MKKYIRVCLLVFALAALMALPAFAGYDSYSEKDAKATIDLTEGLDYVDKVTYETTSTGQYLLVVLAGETTVPNEENILYVDQAEGNGTKVEFTKVYPSAAQTSTICLAGPGLDAPIKLATLNVSGVKVSGQVKSYNPNNATTVELVQAGVVKYSTTIAADSGSGQVTQDFSIASVAAGTYDLVVSKAGHLDYTITGVVVNSDLDLTKNANAAIKLITLLAGDVNADGNINVTDLNTVWNASNYNKSATADGVDSITDINGDGNVNVSDLNIVWNAANYNKIATTHCVITY